MLKKVTAILLAICMILGVSLPARAADSGPTNVGILYLRTPDYKPYAGVEVTIEGKTYVTDEQGRLVTDKLPHPNGTNAIYPFTFKVPDTEDGNNWTYQVAGSGGAYVSVSLLSHLEERATTQILLRQFHISAAAVDTSGKPVQKAQFTYEKREGNSWVPVWGSYVNSCVGGAVDIKTSESIAMGSDPRIVIGDHFRIVARDTSVTPQFQETVKEFDLVRSKQGVTIEMLRVDEPLSSGVPEIKEVTKTVKGINLMLSQRVVALSDSAKECFTIHTTAGDIKPTGIGVMENSIDLSYSTSAQVTGVSYVHNPQTGLVNTRNNSIGVTNFTNVAVGYRDRSVNDSSFEDQVVELVNQERAKNGGLPPLINDPILKDLAEFKVNDFLYGAYFDHLSPAYGYHQELMAKFGVSRWLSAENIAMGDKTPEEVVQGWMDSPGHRANILDPALLRIGVGYNRVNNTWTQIFGNFRYKLKVLKEGRGAVQGSTWLDEGRDATLRATPSVGSQFVNWTENGVVLSEDPNYTFPVGTDKGERTITANFRNVQHTVSLSASDGLGGTGGTVSGEGSFEYTSSQTITATPDEGYLFVNWTQNGNSVSTNPSYTFEVKGDNSFVANFEPANPHVVVTAPSAAEGTITGAGVFDYAHGKTFKLTAAPTRAYIFAGWYNNDTLLSANASYTATANNHMNITARFTPKKVCHIDLQYDKNYGGVTVVAPSGQSGNIFYEGETVTLKAVPTSNGKFQSWSNSDGTAIANPEADTYSFTVTGDKTVTANFAEKDRCVVTLENTNPKDGTVTGLSEYYHVGDTMTLHAEVNPDKAVVYRFVGWYKGDTLLSSNADYTATVNESFTLTAKFAEKTHYKLTAQFEGSTPYGIISGVHPFYYDGETARVTVSPYYGYQFAGWYENGTLLSEKMSDSFVMNANRTLVAKFTEASKVSVTLTSSNPAVAALSGAGDYMQGQTVTVSAGLKSAGTIVFKEWQVNGKAVSTDATYTFQAKENVGLKAVYAEVICAVKFTNLNTVVNGTDALIINGVDVMKLTSKERGSYSLSLKQGSTLSIEVVPKSGYGVDYWQYSSAMGGTVLNGLKEKGTVTVTGDMALLVYMMGRSDTIANLLFQNENGDYLYSTRILKGGSIDPIQSKALATPFKVGYKFVGWDKSTDNIMEDTVFTARYEYAPELFTVTLDNGFAVNKVEQYYSKYVTVDATKSVQARSAAKVFAYWERADGVIVSYDPVYKFLVTSNIELHAVFTDRQVEKKPIIVMDQAAVVDKAGTRISFLAQPEVPSGYDIVEYGVLMSMTQPTAPLTTATTSAIRGKSSAVTGNKFIINKTKVKSGQTYYGRAYLIYKDASGNIYTVYSDLTVSGTMN